MHTIYLGVLNTLVSVVFWALIGANVFSIQGTEEEVLIESVMQIRTRLFGYYARSRDASPQTPLTQLDNLTPGMLGSSRRPVLSAKAVESKDCL
eukprot:4704246-Lingulodinium_polyedra.AAC.1